MKPIRAHACIVIALALVALEGCSAIKRDSPKEVTPAPYVQLTGNLPTGATKADPKERVKANIDLATAYLQARQFKTANEIIQIAIEAEPDNAVALMIKALIRSELKDLPGADETFRSALRIDPNNVDINHNYGTFLCKSGNYSNGRKYIGIALTVPGYERAANSYAAIGSCFEKEGKIEAARANYEKALTADSNAPLALLNLAKLDYENGKYDSARLYMQRFSKMFDSPGSLELSMNIAGKLNNNIERNAFADALERRFPESPEAKRLHEQSQ
jgi:type IV pilus assembly protein PilF